jgi:hypothetical protein
MHLCIKSPSKSLRLGSYGLRYCMLRFALAGFLLAAGSDGGINAAEMAVVADAQDGVLDNMGLLEASLAFSRVSATDRNKMRTTYSQLMSGNEKSTLAGSRQAALFVEHLHRELLTGEFDPDCDGVDRAFVEGRYNCVTSLILSLEFCRRKKIPASAMQSENHVWLRIEGNSTVDLETTTLPQRFELLGAAQPLSDTQLLSRLLYNQARVSYSGEDVRDAVRRLEWALVIDPDFGPANRNLRIVLGNWIASAANHQRFSEAAAVAEQATARFPQDELLMQNAAFLELKWAEWRVQTEATLSEQATP